MRERRTPVSGRGRVDGVTTRQRDAKRWDAGVVLGFGGLGGTVRRQGTDIKMDAGGGKGQQEQHGAEGSRKQRVGEHAAIVDIHS